ncbi:DUF2249 domain-containing protein [Jonesia quinghaiensis]|uniref:DUF2249 domain-containing protein n=1 Tax=Jonesia quinghaiensis TaxID=262806 RepID=UPI0004010C3A|nr:DUF2249 domain-containing protein [Jonesia quinghaiensis]
MSKQTGLEIGEKPTSGCACGDHDVVDYPELDTRVIPHAIRHATIFGALGSIVEGRGMVIVANHNPVPLLTQLEERAPGQFDVTYLEEGPEVYRVQFVRL